MNILLYIREIGVILDMIDYTNAVRVYSYLPDID